MAANYFNPRRRRAAARPAHAIAHTGCGAARVALESTHKRAGPQRRPR